MSDRIPMRYDISRDELVPVTQEWVDMVERQFRLFGKVRAAARVVGADSQESLDAWKPEFEQKL